MILMGNYPIYPPTRPICSPTVTIFSSSTFANISRHESSFKASKFHPPPPSGTRWRCRTGVARSCRTLLTTSLATRPTCSTRARPSTPDDDGGGRGYSLVVYIVYYSYYFYTDLLHDFINNVVFFFIYIKFGWSRNGLG